MPFLGRAGALVAGLLCATAAAAQERDFCADRPGKDTPPCVLDAGRWQVEANFADRAWQRQDGTAIDSLSVGDIEIRRGLTSTLEAQLYWTPYAEVSTRSGSITHRDSGPGDVTVAVRQSLRNPAGDGVSVALQPYVTAPTGAEGIGSGRWTGGVLLPVGIELPRGFGLALTPEVDVAPDADGRGSHLSYAGVVGVSRALGALTLAADLWAQFDDDPTGASRQASFDLSAAWQPAGHEELQFDAGVNLGLTPDTADVEISAGLARRF